MSAETLGALPAQDAPTPPKKTAKQRAEEKWHSPVVVWSQATTEQRELLELAWRRGELSYKLTPSQSKTLRKLERWWKEADQLVYALDIARRWGKSYLLIIIAFSFAIRNPGKRIVYCAPTYEMVRKILLPLIEVILSDCPPSLRPKWIKSEKKWVFPNGSWIDVIGLDLNPDGARGTFVDLVLLDEAGFFDNLSYLVHSVLQPQMLGRELARIICASSPSKTPGHYWSAELVPQSILRGAHDVKTIDDADQYSKKERQKFIDECPGGRNGTTARRELFCEHITDEEIAILPEWRDCEAHTVTDQFTIPTWRDCYTIMDPGFNDLAAVLFCYWDFAESRLVIEDEVARPRASSRSVAESIKKIEARLWGGSMRKGGNAYGLKPQPYMRFSDNEPQLLYDMAVEHELVFAGVQKKSLELMVNAVRVALQEKRIVVHPRCAKLIKHCRAGIWKNQAERNRKFARPSGESSHEFGHFDLVACLIYAWLSVQKHRNPTPAVERVVCGDLKLKQGEGRRKRSKWEQKAPYYRTGKRAGAA